MARNRHYVKSAKLNRNTTVESLEAALALIYGSESKEDFCVNYVKATHDKNGAGVWYYIATREDYEHKRYRDKKNCTILKSGV